MKKVIIIFLLFAYMNGYLGCTKTVLRKTAASDLNSTRSESKNIIVVIDSIKIEFDSKTCRIDNDTLMGKVNQIDESFNRLVNQGIFKESNYKDKYFKVALNTIDEIGIIKEKTTIFGWVIYFSVAIGVSLLIIYMMKSSMDSAIHF